MERLRSAFPLWLLRAAQISVLIGLVVLLLRSVDWRASVALMASADLRWLGAAAVILILQTVLSALRWRVTAGRLGIALSTGQAIREYFLSQLVNQSLPGGVIGDANRAARTKGQAGLMASGQAVVFERLAGQLGLLAVLVLGLVVAAIEPTSMDWPLWLVAPVAASLCVLVCLAAVSAIVVRMSGRTGNVLRSFAHAVAAPDIVMTQAALSLGTAICNVAAFVFCTVALGVNFPILAIATLVPLILSAMALPVSISGWGLREGTAAALFPLVGATASEGLATSVAFGLVFLATMVPGLLVSWLRPNAPVLRRQRATIER